LPLGTVDILKASDLLFVLTGNTKIPFCGELLLLSGFQFLFFHSGFAMDVVLYRLYKHL
jgi:hypothetical protein